MSDRARLHLERVNRVVRLFEKHGFKTEKQGEEEVAGRKVDALFVHKITAQVVCVFVETNALGTPKWGSVYSAWRRIRDEAFANCQLWVLADSFGDLPKLDRDSENRSRPDQVHFKTWADFYSLESGQDGPKPVATSVEDFRRAVREQYQIHRRRREWMQAADCLTHCNEGDDEWREEENLLRAVDVLTKQPAIAGYYTSAVRAAALTRLRQLQRGSLTDDDRYFLEEWRSILKSVSYCEASMPAAISSIYSSALLGRSVVRPFVKSAKNRLVRQLSESNDGSIHNGCSSCTSRAIVILRLLVLRESEPLLVKPLKWLLDQHPYAFSVIAGQSKGLAYLPVAAEALMLNGCGHDAAAAVLHGLRHFSDFEFTSDLDPLWNKANLLSVASRLIEQIPETLKLTGDCFRSAWSEFKESFDRANRFQQVIALPGLLVDPRLVPPEHQLAVVELADRTYRYVSEDPIWDRSTGDWGGNTWGTVARTRIRIAYWDWRFAHHQDLAKLEP